MPLKKSHGNMYDWVTHMHSHLGGECLHKCQYCYVQRNRFGVSPRYKGKIRLIEEELTVNYGSGKIIFIEHMNDLFAADIPHEWKKEILAHCYRYSDNQYVFQTKNPLGALLYQYRFPPDILIGTTIETNRDINSISQAPCPEFRYMGIKQWTKNGFKTFVTIEPIMDFDLDVLVRWITEIYPVFVNIGADSKNCNLPEPSAEKIKELIHRLQINGITIKKKINLTRLLNRQEFPK